jgi:hypothetical protein
VSWHHGDWLSLAQAVASSNAVVGAFGVVFCQHWLEKRRIRQDQDRLVRFACSYVSRAHAHLSMFVELLGGEKSTDLDSEKALLVLR